MNKTFAISIILILSFAIPGVCIDYYVDSMNGSDDNTGLAEDEAFATITHALTLVLGTKTEPAQIFIAEGDYTLHSGETFPLEMKSHVSLVGSEDYTTNIDAIGSDSSVISFNGAVETEISYLRITGGAGTLVQDLQNFTLNYRLGGGIYAVNDADFTVSHCQITENFLFGSNDYGGGIYCSAASPYIIDSTINYNIGGGIYVSKAFGAVVRSDIMHNSQGNNVSGGIYLDTSFVSVYYCNIEDNNSAGIRMTNAMANIFSCEIHSNSDSGIFMTNGSNFTMHYTNLTHNSGFVGGGITCLFGSSPQIKSSTIEDNSAIFLGGGLFLFDGSSPTITNSTIAGNNAARGGGIYCDNSSPYINACKISGNEVGGAGSAGGGIYCRGDSEFQLMSSVISGNKASFGGGIHSYNTESMNVTNCLFIQNRANSFGGAVHFVNSSTMLTNCTIVDNIADNTEGGVSIASGNVTIMNSILWNNTGGSIGGTALANVIYNNIEGGYGGTGNIEVDPLFVHGPRGDYYLSQAESGQDYMSLCVDAGNIDVPSYDFKPERKTTRTDGVFDSNTVDLGYHYPPHIEFGLVIEPSPDSFAEGDTFEVLESINSAPEAFSADIYFVLTTPDSNLYAPGWNTSPNPVMRSVIVQINLGILNLSIMEITLPSENPPIGTPGDYTFTIFATKPGTHELISDFAEAHFSYGGLF